MNTIARVITILFILSSQSAWALDAEPAAPVAVSAALPSADHDVGDVEVKILQVQRAPGDMLMVRWQYTNKSTEKKVVIEGDAGHHGYALARSTYLIDNQYKKKYLVVEDSSGTPVASKLGSYGKVEVEAGKTLTSWTKFPAPPAAVQKISIYIAGVAPFEEVPIS